MKRIQISLCRVLAILFIPGIVNAQLSNNNTNNKKKEPGMFTIEKNKEVVRRLYEELLNKKNMQLLPELISEDYIGANEQKGIAAFEAPLAPLLKAFPDIEWELEQLIAEGNSVMVRSKWRGTHLAQFNNLKASQKRISTSAIVIYELKNDKIVGSTVQTDRLGFLQELDVLPLDLTQLSTKNAYKDRVNFIDKFLVPAAAKTAFYERMHINREFIKLLPGFIEDAVYSYTDKDSNLVCITIALWESQLALENAKKAVQAEYKKQGFDAADMFKRLNIVADRGVYREMEE